ncbi:hypothetical protein C4579_03455 [Candidatus Microgenomates bacterium]|nr:MAG: hypothetical protein C4579_03455 [Candidatus Microgenomates bacterium]
MTKEKIIPTFVTVTVPSNLTEAEGMPKQITLAGAMHEVIFGVRQLSFSQLTWRKINPHQTGSDFFAEIPSDSQPDGKEKSKKIEKKGDTLEYSPEGLERLMSNAQAFIGTLEGAGSISQAVVSKLRGKIQETIADLKLSIKSERMEQN